MHSILHHSKQSPPLLSVISPNSDHEEAISPSNNLTVKKEDTHTHTQRREGEIERKTKKSDAGGKNRSRDTEANKDLKKKAEKRGTETNVIL